MFLVNKLKQETEVMINIPDSDKAPSNVIRIEGNKDGVKKAKEVSNRILNFRAKKTSTECLRDFCSKMSRLGHFNSIFFK